MKTLQLVNETSYTLTGREWFVTCTDKLLSGWGRAENKTCKRVIICQTKGEALTMVDRLQNPKHLVKNVNYTSSLPYYTPSKYVVTYDVFTPRLFNF